MDMEKTPPAFCKTAGLALILALFLAIAPGARAQVYVNGQKPEDWDTRPLLRLTVFRTGESDCMLMEADGEAMMIDGGANKYREKLWNALTERGYGHLKYLYSTHPHDDHIDGLYRIMQYGVTADEFLSSFSKTHRNDLQKRTVQQAEKSAIPFRQVMDGDEITLGSATLKFYQWYDGKTIDAQCPMVRVEYGGTALLLTSDIIGETQRHFLDTLPAEVFKADILKAPHHGLTGIVSEFITAVDPGFVFITNYEGDAKKTVNLCKNRNIPYLHAGEGTLILETDGQDWYVEQLLHQF